MISDDTNLFQNLKLSKQIEETNNDGDSTLNGYFEHNAVSLIRSPRFKRRKSSAENNYTVISEIRRCSTRTLTTSNLKNKVFLNTAKRSLNFGDEQKNELNLVPAVKDFKQHSQQTVDTAELNDTYLYHAILIPGNTRANRKAKKIESIREKFEKISAISSILPHEKFNKVRFRRGCSSSGVNNESLNRKSELVETQGEIRKVRHDGTQKFWLYYLSYRRCFEIEQDKGNMQLPVPTNTVKVPVKSEPSDDGNLTVTDLSAVSSVSSLSNFEVNEVPPQIKERTEILLVKCQANGSPAK
ncbi:hypothetical protein X798_03604 [Onchocerca flexuosa]|uniref:Uncharacterized protein n=1 Tax=Onchocerca flexuosa TaxID=387005 RepID=A0A238BW88_9BILA|nr:hypothetical protein X798_03604 [Onchocerca flexuosa]